MAKLLKHYGRNMQQKDNQTHLEILRDKESATEYLNKALKKYLQDINAPVNCFLLAIGDVIRANQGITELSYQTKMSRGTIHRIISGKINPNWFNVYQIIQALGLKIDFMPK